MWAGTAGQACLVLVRPKTADNESPTAGWASEAKPFWKITLINKST